jgi:hypothetical protein
MGAYSKIIDFTQEKINACKAAARCRFEEIEGQLEHIAITSMYVGDEMNNRHKQMEIATLDKMVKHIERIKDNLRKETLNIGNRNEYI